jgi:predicted ATP-grasp superfamily ATP-dependent carboligase
VFNSLYHYSGPIKTSKILLVNASFRIVASGPTIIPLSNISKPEGAASIIEVLNQMYNLNIETAKLIEEGKEIKAKMLELAEKAQQYQQQQQLPQESKERYTQYFQ